MKRHIRLGMGHVHQKTMCSYSCFRSAACVTTEVSVPRVLRDECAVRTLGQHCSRETSLGLIVLSGPCSLWSRTVQEVQSGHSLVTISKRGLILLILILLLLRNFWRDWGKPWDTSWQSFSWSVLLCVIVTAHVGLAERKECACVLEYASLLIRNE